MIFARTKEKRFAISWNTVDGIVTLHRRKGWLVAEDLTDENSFNLKEEELFLFIKTLLQDDQCKTFILRELDLLDKAPDTEPSQDK